MPINTSELTAQQQITAIYVAYYDRAPDPAGLQFWTGQLQGGRSLDQIATDFSGAAETKEKYPFFDAPDVASADTFITSIYVNLFGRTPDDAGRDFWSEQLESGSTDVGEIILAILEGAQDEASGGFPDSETITNKIDVGLDWAQSAIEAGIGLSNNPIAEEIEGQVVVNNQAAFDSATSVLDGVDGTPQSVTDAKAATDAFIASGGGVSEVFTLTSNVDDLTGTPGNDVFNAPLGQTTDIFGTPVVFQTLTAVDEIDGEEGTDRLNARLIDGSASGVLIDNVENLFLRSSDDAAALNMSGVTGAEQVWSDRSTGNLTISAIQTGVVLGVTQGNGSDYTASYANDAIGADFTQTVVLQDADIGNLVVNEGGGTNAITGLALNVTGSDVELGLGGDLQNVTDLAIEGDADLDLSSTVLADLETIESTTTGDVSVVAGDVLETANFGEGDDTLVTGGAAVETIGMGAGDDEVTIDGTDLADGAAIDMGEGDDRLDLGNNLDLSTTAGELDTTVSLNGGAGMNTLAMTSATAAAVSTDDAGFDAQFENFQKLEIGEVATGDADVVDLSNMNDIDYVVSSGTAPTTGTEEVQRIDVGSSDADGGVLTVGGVDITIPSGPGGFFGNQFDVAGAIEAREADIIAANPDVVSVDRVFSGGFFVADWDVNVTYSATSGDQPNIPVADSSSGVTFSAVSETDGTDEVAQTDTLTVDTAPVTSGLITVSIDNDGSGVTTETDIQVEVIAGETVNQVAAKISDAIDAANLSGVSSVSVTGDTVTVNYNADITGAGQINFTDTGGTSTTATPDTTQVYVAPVAESQDVTVTSGTDPDGGEIVVAGVRIELEGNLTPNEVAGEILNNLTAITANSDVVGVSFDSTSSTLTFNFAQDAGDVPAIQIEDNASTGVAATVTEIQTGVAGAAAGTLTLDAMASGGTLELTDALEGDATVNVTDAALAGSTDDEFNIKLNGVAQIANTAALNVASVETINIETANSDEDNLPNGASDLNLQAADAETVNVTGNHGVDFDGSNLDSMTLLDASGVQATESVAGADDAGDVGKVTIDTGATDADVTILTGNGDDDINASFVGAGNAATIEAGAGDDGVIGSQGDDSIDLGEGADVVTSSAGADTITLGAGNDTYLLNATQDSVINNRDEITDFSPNTVGQGAGGAATDAGAIGPVDDRDGDVIDLSGFGGAPLSVAVFANASNATTFLANNDNDGEMNIALDSSTGFLYIDTGDDGIANSVIELTGVTTIDEAAFVI